MIDTLRQPEKLRDLFLSGEFAKDMLDETNLDAALFEGKRRVIELRDVHGTLAVENDEKVFCHV